MGPEQVAVDNALAAFHNAEAELMEVQARVAFAEHASSLAVKDGDLEAIAETEDELIQAREALAAAEQKFTSTQTEVESAYTDLYRSVRL
jgi:hypothetical protein